MRYAIFADVHGNLEAYEAVLAAIEKEGPDRIFCIGDLVGYGSQPSECVARTRDLGCLTVIGNHDAAAVGRLTASYFNPFAREAILWTGAHLSEEDKEFLLGLPLVEEIEDFTLVHATLDSPEGFDYIDTLVGAERCFSHLKQPVVFIGHSHIPVAFFDTEPTTYTQSWPLRIPAGRKAIVNVGSVGQPRDGNPDAAYAIYDTDKGLVYLHRVPYDVEATSRKILDAGLPSILAERLHFGM